MSDIDIVRINKTPYSATSTSFRFVNAPFVGILAFDYSEKRERKLVHAARRDGTPLGMTSGKYSVDGLSAKMLLASFDRLTTILTPLGLGSYGDVKFPIEVQYIEPQAVLQGVLPVTISIEDACITGVKSSFAEGIDESVVELEFMALSMRRNGKQLWSLANGFGQ